MKRQRKKERRLAKERVENTMLSVRFLSCATVVVGPAAECGGCTR